MSTSSLKVSVVIIAKDEPRIRYTLQSLSHQTVKPYEVLVIVDKLHDLSAKIAREHSSGLPLRIIVNDEVGYGGARKKGVEEARGDIVAFIDADCVADKEWIQNIVEAFSKKDVAVQAGGVIHIKSFKDFLVAENRKDNQYTILRFAPTQNFAFKRELVSTIGNFDSWFREGGEDLDFCIRLKKMGYKIYYNPRCKVYHWAHGLDIRKSWRDGRSRAKNFVKHGSEVLSDAFICFFHTLSLMIFIVLLATGSLQIAILVFAPSLLHRLYRAFIHMKQGNTVLTSLLHSFSAYIIHVSFVVSLLYLIPKRVRNK